MPSIGMQTLRIRKVRHGQDNDEWTVKFDCYVDKAGLFTTTLPNDVVQVLKESKIDLNKNRTDKHGFFSAETLAKLTAQIKDICEEALSRKEIENVIVLCYCINTTASYLIGDDGKTIIPNGNWCNYADRTNETGWRWGTTMQDACHPHPFGIQAWVQPKQRITYEYKSGVRKTEYHSLGSHFEIEDESNYNLRWLDGLCSIKEPDNGISGEIPYTEENAKFFVDLMTAIAILNEKIKPFLEPKALLELIARKQKFIG